jgi:hypothetical protein
VTASPAVGAGTSRRVLVQVAVAAALLGVLATLGVQRLAQGHGRAFTGDVSVSREDGSLVCVAPDGGGEPLCGLPVAVEPGGDPVRGAELPVGTHVSVEVRHADMATAPLLVMRAVVVR